MAAKSRLTDKTVAHPDPLPTGEREKLLSYGERRSTYLASRRAMGDLSRTPGEALNTP